MRELHEIQKDIEQARIDLDRANKRLSALYEEKRQRKFLDFCNTYDVEPGTIVNIPNFGTVQIVGADRGEYSVMCHKICKNGQPARNTISYSTSMFKNCEIIGFKPLC